MASKFMAFENVASTSASTSSMENHGDEENERIEMNGSQYRNYQSNHNPGVTTEPSPYGAVDEEDDLNENFEEKFEKDLSYRKFIYNNSEQLKCIFGGVLLLMGSGIHIVWGIFRVFYLYICEEENSFHFRFIIWSWYIGAIMGCCSAGYAVAKIRKGHLYSIGGTLLILSGIFLMFSENNTDIYLLASRTVGGFTQGLIYVVVIVHTSENATKEFREFLMLIVGAALNYSILLSVLAFFHTEGLFKSSVLNGLGLILFGLTTIVITMKHATETVPFILQNNGSELDAIQIVGKLKKKPLAARSVHHDFLIMKNLVHDEMERYGSPNFQKVLLPENRKSLIFCCYGRLCSVLSFNLPLIVMIMLFLRQWADGHFETPTHHAKEHCLGFIDVVRNTTDNHSTNDATPTTEKPKFLESTTESMKIETPKQPENGKHDDENPNESDGKRKIREVENKNEKNHNGNESNEKETEKNEEKLPNDGKVDLKQSEEETKPKEEKEEKKVQKTRTGDHKQEPERHGKSKEAKKEQQHEVIDERNKESKDKTDKKPEESPEKSHEIEKSAPTILSHLLIFLHSRELTLVLLAWFIFGTITAAILYKLNLKRFIYYISCVLSSVLAITGIAHSFHFLSGILHICLIVYFNYVTIPIDVFGHCMLAEAFPVTLKAFSVASVAIIEHIVHIIVITLYLSDWFHNSILLLMCIVAFVSHEIATNLPQKDSLTLAEAREQYQNINLMLFNDPKSGYNQEQEFI